MKSIKNRKTKQLRAGFEIEFLMAARHVEKSGPGTDFNWQPVSKLMSRIQMLIDEPGSNSWYTTLNGTEVMEKLFAAGLEKKGEYEGRPQAVLPARLGGA